MKFRMNGRSFRSASDIAQIIASVPTEELSVEERERRVELYASRFASGVNLWTGEDEDRTLSGDAELMEEFNEFIPDGEGCGECGTGE